MARTLLGVALALAVLAALTSCSLDASGDDESGGGESAGGEAKEFKAEMDSLARELLPDLVEAIGSRPEELEARFIERGGFGVWDYQAGSTWEVKGEPRLDKVEQVLTDHGMPVERPGTTSDITATQGNVRVSVSWDEGAAISTATLEFNTLDAAGGDDEYAEQAPPTDYLGFLR
ncbi:hypothetical protein [Nocardioides gansuensis]|nr:hypothetical protein [Nocardioides gansuensis]